MSSSTIQSTGCCSCTGTRFITDNTGFELPAGGVNQGESIAGAAAREVLEKTGWAVSTPKIFMQATASDGLSTQRFYFAYAQALEEIGEPVDAYEADRLYWAATKEVLGLLKDGVHATRDAVRLREPGVGYCAV